MCAAYNLIAMVGFPISVRCRILEISVYWNLDVEKKGADWWREVGLWEVIYYRGCHVAVAYK